MNEKGRLRAAARAARDAMPEDARREESAAVTRAALAWGALSSARTVFCYCSFASEVDTAALIAALHQRGQRVALPITRGGGRMDAALYRPGDELTPSRFGPSEPLGGAVVPPGDIDVILLPGLVFTRAGERLGYGGGFYDRYLPQTRALRAALAFRIQVADELPACAHDQRVHALITADGVLHAR